MSESARPPRKRAAVVIAFALLALGGALGVDHARLTRLEKSVRAGGHTQALAQLSAQHASLVSDVRELTAAPRAASEASVDALKARWEARIAAIESSALACATAHDLAELADRMDVVETRQSRARRSSAGAANPIAPATAPSAVPAPAKLDPPFVPLSIELRGGERFLSIMPAGASSLSAARALRPGDREENWILERLERGIAEFRVDGQVQRVSIPQ